MDLIYSDFRDDANEGKPSFEKLFDIFKQLLNISAGNAGQALQWLTELDRRYNLAESPYSVAQFIQDLKDRGFLQEDGENNVVITPKTERTLRKAALEEVFSRLKGAQPGAHKTTSIGRGHEPEPEIRPWHQGEDLRHLDVPATLLQSLRRSADGEFTLSEADLMVHETDHYSATATVLCIDLSHSMVLYGEDRITPARKVALGLTELITTRYPKDTLEIVAFGDEAWRVTTKELPYLQVGPFHTNTQDALRLARQLLKRSRLANRQILMITDGKPSCMKEGASLYKNSFGLDRKIVNAVLAEAAMCRKDKIPITTFMIATDPYLQEFVEELTKTNQGRAYYAGLDELGGFVLQDYLTNRRKTVR